MIDLDTLSREFGSDLEDKMMNSVSDQQRILTVESFILQRLQQKQIPQLPVFEVLKFILTTTGNPKVKELSTDYFVSERQLERQFQKFTGFVPKQFIRINRFNRAIRLYGNRDFRLIDIALDCGYYDQSHFINDFKQFSGLSPKDFFRGKTPATDWLDSEVG